MEIVLKIFASLTGVLGVFILIAAMLKGFEHKGMTMAGISYLLGGILSVAYGNWLPAIAGIILAVVIKRKYGEPNYERTPDYGFTLTKNETTDNEKIGKFILAFLKSDSIGKNLLDEKYQRWSEIGFLRKFAMEVENKEPMTKNLVPWFMNYVRPKINQLTKINSVEFNELVRNLNDQSGNHLETIFKMTAKYNLSSEQIRANTDYFAEFVSKEDYTIVCYSVFADNINCQLRSKAFH